MKVYSIIIISIITWIGCKEGNTQLTSVKQDQVVTPPNQKQGLTLHWLTIDDLDEIDPTDGKRILVDVYTDWCGYCKIMDRHTFTDPEVVAFLSKNYHVIKFNAEQKEAVRLDGQVFEWKPGGRNGYNELARQMLDGQMSYPSIVYYDQQKVKIIAIPGYKKPDQLLSDIERVEQLE